MNLSTGQTRPTITPDFSHRIAVNTSNLEDLSMSVSIMTDRAIAVLHLLSLHVKCTDIIAQSAIDSASNELLDVQKYISAFAKSQTNTQ